MTTINTAHVSKVTLHRLRATLLYDAASGEFRGVAGTGSALGRVTSHGYLVVNFDGQAVMAHRLAWLHVHGRWPLGQIDHINGDKLDNRIANLRDVSQTTNMQNQKRAHSGSRTGLLGVYWHKKTGRPYAQLRVNGKLLTLGYFDTPESAHAAYIEAKRRLHPGNTL